MKRKLLVVSNPTSGGRKRNQKILRELSNFLLNNELDASVRVTEIDQNAQQIIKNHLDSSFTDIVIVGGDDTINEAVNGLELDIPMTIIPAGTGNDFVKNIPLGKTLSKQFEVLINENIKPIDLGICNDRKFANGVGIGFDGQIVEDMRTKTVPFLKGHAKYYYHVLQVLASYETRDFSFSLDETSSSKPLIIMAIGNGTTFGGGFKLMPNARVDDGLLEVCTIGNVSPLRRFMNIHKLSNGTHGTLTEVDFHQVTSVHVQRNPLLFAHVDGELMGNPPYEIKVLPNALKLRV